MSQTQSADVISREDIANFLAIADMKDTPFTTQIPKGAAPAANLTQWVVDAYRTPTTAGVVEGQDVSSFQNEYAYMESLSNYVQEQRVAPSVSQRTEFIDNIPGINNGQFGNPTGNTPFDYAKAKSIKELKRDIELTLLSNNEAQNQSGGNPYLIRGMGSWISSTQHTVLPFESTRYLTPAASIYSGALTDFDEADMKALLQSRYEQTGNSPELKCFCGTNVKARIDTFTQYATDIASNTAIRMYYNEDDYKYSSMVDIYDSSFGKVTLTLDNFMPNQKTAYIIDMRYVDMGPLLPIQVKPIEDEGGGPRCLARTMYTLRVKNPLAMAKIAAS
jgi:hypothetical protein